MSDHKCINPFFSQVMTKRYGYGELITTDHYYSLPTSEKANFNRNDVPGNLPSNSDTLDSGSSSWLSSFDNLNSDYSSDTDYGSGSSDSSNDSSFDFGGGDTGGGGASGDW